MKIDLKNLVGKKWSSLSEEVQNELLSSYVTNDEFYKETTDCIVDFDCNVSVGGRMVVTDEERYFEVDNDSVFYDSRG